MNASLSGSATAPLLFHWDSPGGRKAAITMFLIGSLVAHLLCFYVFQIVYPPTVALLPPPARVSLITPDTEEGRALLRWIEAEDPALAFATHRPPEARLRALPKIAHVPSYLTREPILKSMPPRAVDLRAPSPQMPGPVPIVHGPIAPAVGAIPTSLSFSEELSDLGAPNIPVPKFASSNSEPAQSIRFRIAVGQAGDIRHCFALNSSGDPALDEQARGYIVLCRFPAIRPALAGQPAIRNSLTWGVVTINWGNDIARPPATSITVPVP